MKEQVPEIQQPTEQIELTQTNADKKFSKTKKVLLIIVLGLLLFAGFSLAKACITSYKWNQFLKNQGMGAVPSTKYLTQIPKPTEIVDETANWKTYTNTEAGFEFKYPQNFRITAEGVGQYFLNQKPAVVLGSDNFSYLHNQINAILTVSVKSNAESGCTYVPRGVANTLHNQVINGINFTVFSESGAAAGNIFKYNFSLS